MKYKYHFLLASAVLMFAACSEDISDLEQKGSAYDPIMNYDGPLNVSISFGGGEQTTRTSIKLTGEVNDPYVGKHPYPVTAFNEKDTVGIVQLATLKNGVTQVYNYKAITADGGDNWAIQDVDGNESFVRHFIGRENVYFAYSPYVEGGLSDNADFLTASLPTVKLPRYDEYSDIIGEEEVATPPSSFFEPLITRVLEQNDQSKYESFNNCDLLGARGVCTTDEQARTATLHFQLGHMVALDIIALKKWDGNVTIYGTYDTWVAPDKNIWRMKQQMKPTLIRASDVEPMFPIVDAVSAGTNPLLDINGNQMDGTAPAFEGLGNWYWDQTQGADTCRYYMQFVKSYTARMKYGYANSASAGGWLVDIPPISAGRYVVVSMPYYRYFRQKGYMPQEDDSQAGETWKKTWRDYFKSYTWTYEDILFPDVEHLYDYNQILEVGDQLLANGNIAKAGTTTGVGTVKWIAYVPFPWLNTTAYDNLERPYFSLNYLIYGQRGGSPRNPTFEKVIPEAFWDNGYRPYGTQIETNGVKHLVIDHEANGCATLDDFWRTDICNHFMVFSNTDVTYKSNSEDIKHNDPIFSLAIPSITINPGNGIIYYDKTPEHTIQGYYPYSWVFMYPDWYFNKDGVSGARSNMPASSANGPTTTGNSTWMVPTVTQYYLANYSEYNGEFDKNLLTCNYVPCTNGHENEGMAVLKGSYRFGISAGTEKPVYFGDGHIYLFTGAFESFDTSNDPEYEEYNYAALPISGVTSATGTKGTNGSSTTVTYAVEKDKMYIYSKEGSPIVDVPTDYTPCISY